LHLNSNKYDKCKLRTFLIFLMTPAPQVTKLVTKDVICARRTVPAHGTSLAVPAQFDTVLARQSDACNNLQHPLDGM